jgi:hypothetical protein
MITPITPNVINPQPPHIEFPKHIQDAFKQTVQIGSKQRAAISWVQHGKNKGEGKAND